MKVIISEDALRDLEKAADFYEEQEPGAGGYFLDKMIREIDRLDVVAGIHRQVWGYYKMVAERFPYLIFYRLSEDTVQVKAVVDGRRDPKLNRNTITERRTQDDVPQQ